MLRGSATARADYANRLRRAFLSNGFDISVLALESRPKDSLRQIRPVEKYPQLHMFGPLTNPAVYQLITDGGVLLNAKELQFRSIEFFSNLGQGGWWFDISGPALPDCDQAKRVCR